MAQDADEIIMLINYYIAIAETASESSGAPQASDKAAAKSFWAAL